MRRRDAGVSSFRSVAYHNIYLRRFHTRCDRRTRHARARATSDACTHIDAYRAGGRRRRPRRRRHIDAGVSVLLLLRVYAVRNVHARTPRALNDGWNSPNLLSRANNALHTHTRRTHTLTRQGNNATRRNESGGGQRVRECACAQTFTMTFHVNNRAHERTRTRVCVCVCVLSLVRHGHFNC